MSKKHESAFPLMGEAPEDGAPIEHHGMHLRDFFAAMAMQARIMTHCQFGHNYDTEEVPAWAYEMADYMLIAREKWQ